GPPGSGGGVRVKPVIVVPTYNEVGNIARLIPELLALDASPDVLVVDDSSPDGTAEAVEGFASTGRVHLLKRPVKQGLGAAYVNGFRRVLETPGYDAVVQMDADFSHAPAKVPELLAALEDHDVAIGSRYCSGVNVVNWPITRLLLSYFANQYTRVITGLPVRDATGGFKAIRREALEKLDLNSIRSDGYSFQIEVTYKLYRKGCRIVEVPIVFIDRHSGTSKMTKKIVWEAVWMVWKLRFPWLA
ncbi:polyprenol monophosphomannose synthase, partial [Candidatus Fermentibacterales bacterium]|nr:polyprenol monophosphomannose synthase [Candidatus Fermentibacterales bacterium]